MTDVAPGADGGASSTVSSLRERILGLDDITRELVDVPEWECKIEVRSMTARERSLMIANAVTSNEGVVRWADLYPAMVVACSFDPETGEQIFEPGDEEVLTQRNAAPVERLAMTAMRVSGMSNAGQAQLGKDSEPNPSDESI
jgi:hypothetical protein